MGLLSDEVSADGLILVNSEGNNVCTFSWQHCLYVDIVTLCTIFSIQLSHTNVRLDLEIGFKMRLIIHTQYIVIMLIIKHRNRNLRTMKMLVN